MLSHFVGCTESKKGFNVKDLDHKAFSLIVMIHEGFVAKKL